MKRIHLWLPALVTRLDCATALQARIGLNIEKHAGTWSVPSTVAMARHAKPGHANHAV